MNGTRVFVILVHGFIGWALCGAVMGIGPLLMSMQTTLIVHAIAAPVFFFVISLFYHRKFNYTTPFQTSLVFTGFVIFIDFFLVALIIQGNVEMFGSILGTWLPFVLIFVATYCAGLFAQKSS
ncbi:hypothetical protein AMJ87_12445 [candidate division WOR_3 bacterium SM23_60]|uniref:Uncharacterized protein n=1 Tax=candidate division WOR_3 bacterium SM23_60 TaxID=1703780 RepID=A0A0S8G4X5_UNCW3|nr:MAG: hypothetical protein AMJ87_12445 [candidate division WOR_3 bacterium SM23_60]